jgi:hypothetical protein
MMENKIKVTIKKSIHAEGDNWVRATYSFNADSCDIEIKNKTDERICDTKSFKTVTEANTWLNECVAKIKTDLRAWRTKRDVLTLEIDALKLVDEKFTF